MKLLVLLFLFSFNLTVALAQGEFYDVMPDISSCNPGQLKEIEKQKILNKVNQIRAIHGLKPVTYNYSKDDATQRSALITAANEMLSHQPPSNWKCYSQAGYVGAERSNLHIKWFFGNTFPKSEESINSWMIDMNVDVCGHRRWIIDPFLKFIAFGRADAASTQNPQFKVSGASIYVIDNEKQNISDWDGDFVAYPYKEYPTELVFDSQNKYWHFNFTAISNKNDWWSNRNVSYTGAILEIKDESNNTVQFTDLTSNNEGYGVPNMLRWKITNLQKEKRYNVTVRNVDLNGTKKDFSYWFKITDNPSSGTVPEAPMLSLPPNNATNQQTSLTLTWNSVPSANSYNVQVATDASFNQLFLDQTNVTGTSLNVSGLSKNSFYFWRVSGTNNSGNGPYSNSYSFQTGSGQSANQVIVSYPANEETSIPTNATIKWAAVANAESYHLQISDSEKFPQVGLPIDQQNIPGVSYELPAKVLREDKSYWLRVRAMVSGAYQDWSEVHHFRTWILASVYDNIENNDEFNVNPNPASSKVILNVNYRDVFSISIFDESGRMVHGFDRLQDAQSIELELTGFANGTYYVVLNSDSGRFLRKFQVIK